MSYELAYLVGLLHGGCPYGHANCTLLDALRKEYARSPEETVRSLRGEKAAQLLSGHQRCPLGALSRSQF